jgi:hypothetical protein
VLPDTACPSSFAVSFPSTSAIQNPPLGV